MSAISTRRILGVQSAWDISRCFLNYRMKLMLVFFATTVLVVQFTNGQDTIPLLKGEVDISLANGTFKCDLVLQNIPRIQDYVIRLNSGMNPLYFKSLDNDFLIYYDKSLHDTLSTGE